MLLEPATTKAFAMVQDLCDHLRICALVKIIKKWARANNKQASAWKLADNSIVAATQTNALLTPVLVDNAIALAQKHLDREDEEDPEVETLTTNGDEIAALKAQLAEAQQSIAALQTNTNSQPQKRKWGGAVGNGAAGGGGGKGGGPD